MTRDQQLALILLVNTYTRLVDLTTQKSPTKDILEAQRECTDALHDLLRAVRFPGSQSVVTIYERWMQGGDRIAYDANSAYPYDPIRKIAVSSTYGKITGHTGDHDYTDPPLCGTPLRESGSLSSQHCRLPRGHSGSHVY